MILPADAHLAGKHMFGCCKPVFNRPSLKFERVNHQRVAGSFCLRHIRDKRQISILDNSLFRRPPRSVPCFRNNSKQGLSVKLCLADRKDRIIMPPDRADIIVPGISSAVRTPTTPLPHAPRRG